MIVFFKNSPKKQNTCRTEWFIDWYDQMFRRKQNIYSPGGLNHEVVTGTLGKDAPEILSPEGA